MVHVNAFYALMMTVLVAGALGFRSRQKRKETEGIYPAFEQCKTPSVRFSDIAANEEAMESLRDVLSFIQSPEAYSRLGARIPRGILLYGMPGTGKTLMAKALAGESGAAFFAVNGADFVEMYVGVGAGRIRSLFRKARKSERAVIFIDEIDAIGKKRDNRSDEREQTLNALLCEMSGFSDSDSIVVLAATNRVDTLDEALLRAGRFDRHIEVPLPNEAQRKMILTVHARTKPMACDVSFDELARQTVLFSGAKLECLLNEAAIIAVKRGGEQIESEDIVKAMDKTLFGSEKTDFAALEKERRITAAHEAGHAAVTAALMPESKIEKVSIIPTSKGAAGYSMATSPEKLFHQKQELIAHMAVALAGREAEAMLLGRDFVSTGAANDIEKAAVLARRMVTEWGMLPGSDEVYLFSQQQKNAACQQWLCHARQMACAVLLQNRAGWEKLTDALLEKETLSGQEVLSCLSS